LCATHRAIDLLVDVLKRTDFVGRFIVTRSRTNLHFNLQRAAVKLLAVLDLHNASRMTNCGQLLVSNFLSHWIAVAKVQSCEDFAVCVLTIQDGKAELKVSA
jgi:isocitrate dehydrogenase kinase/phosphatase